MHAAKDQVPRGIAYMLGSTVMFAGGNAVGKWQLIRWVRLRSGAAANS